MLEVKFFSEKYSYVTNQPKFGLVGCIQHFHLFADLLDFGSNARLIPPIYSQDS